MTSAPAPSKNPAHSIAKHTAFLLHVDYGSSLTRTILRLTLKEKETGRVFRLYDESYEPYFYIEPEKPNASKEEIDELIEQIKATKAYGKGQAVQAKHVERDEKLRAGKTVSLIKVVCHKPTDVPTLHDAMKKFGQNWEHRIPFIQRYLMDKQLKPTDLVEIESDGKFITKIEPSKTTAPLHLRVMAFDIETYNPRGISEPEKDPALMISWAANGPEATSKPTAGVISYAKKFSHEYVDVQQSEKAMLEKFGNVIDKHHVDLLTGYNSDVFDVPFLAGRAKKLGAALKLGRDHKLPKISKHGIRERSAITGRIHFDAYPVVSFLNFIGSIKLNRLTLLDAYSEITGNKKVTVQKPDIYKLWDSATSTKASEDLDHLAFYNKDDSLACLAVTNYVLPLQIAMCRLTGNLLYDNCRATASQLVEPFLMRKAFLRNELIPQKPGFGDVQARSDKPVEGAFVKLPNPGVYENIAVLDFKSLYPSIIITHNVDPSTLNCDCCDSSTAFVSPQGHRFCSKRKGIVPAALEEILKTRFAIQKEMKQLADKESPQYKQLYAEQWGLKILANSMYGYLLFARSRWYTREGGESTTAWARQYIQETIKKAEDSGLPVLYSDTDSLFIQYQTGGEKKVDEFKKSVNEVLPKGMELELEDYYPRGIFVSKKQEGKGAKKKYALVNKEGKIKIRGFELVRRDWSKLARNLQREVLEILLRDGNVPKALDVVRKEVERLRKGKVPLEELAILTQLRKKPSEYAVMSPEVSAFLKAKKAGIPLADNSVINFVITSNGKTISEKAQVLELAKDYDVDYYLNHQLLPAVLKILSELGVDEQDILTNSKQHSLSGW